MNIKRFKEVQKIVEEVLREDEDTRKDDFLLISRVLEVINPETKDMTVGYVLLNGKELNLPSFESITRARRTIFRKYPELNPEYMKELRQQEENEYRKMSRKDEI